MGKSKPEYQKIITVKKGVYITILSALAVTVAESILSGGITISSEYWSSVVLGIATMGLNYFKHNN